MKIMHKILLTLIAVCSSLAIQASAPAPDNKAPKESIVVNSEPEQVQFSIVDALRYIGFSLEEVTQDPELVKKYRLLAASLIKVAAKKRDFISEAEFEEINNKLLKKLENEIREKNIPTPPTVAQAQNAAPALIDQINQLFIEYFNAYSSASLLKIKKALSQAEYEEKDRQEAEIKELIDLIPREQVINNKDNNGKSVLQNAIKYNCLPVVQYLMERTRVPILDFTEGINQKLLKNSGAEVQDYFKQKEAEIAAYLKKKQEEQDKKEEPSKEQLKQAHDFWKKKQQEKAIDKLKHFAQNHKTQNALNAKARAHAKDHVEKSALKKAINAMHTYAQNKKADKHLEKKAFRTWQYNAKLQKNQRKQEKIYMDRAEKFHKERMLKTAFSGLKDAAEKTKKQEPVLQDKALKHAQQKESLKTKKMLAAWKEKTAEQIHNKKEMVRVKEELQADLEQYNSHCDNLDLQPDRSAVIELEKLVERIEKTISHDKKFDYYIASREPILNKMYTSLKNDAAKIEEYHQAKAKKDRQDLEQLMDKEYHQDKLDYQQRCAKLNITYRSRYLSQLANLAHLTKQSFSSPEDRVTNYRAKRIMPLQKVHQELDNILNRDYILFKEMCIQSMAILNQQQILEKTNYMKPGYRQIIRICHNITLHHERATRENLQAQIDIDRKESHSKINNILSYLKNKYEAQTPSAVGNGKDEKHSAESRTNTATTAPKMTNEYDSDENEYEYEQVCKSAAHKIGALKLDAFIQKRKARQALRYWNLEFDNGRCTEREKAILKKDGAVKMKKFFERKEQQELRKAWQKFAALKTNKDAQAEQAVVNPQIDSRAESELAPSVAALFAAWDNQQAARVVCAKEAQEAHIVHTPVPAGKEENKKLMLSPLKKKAIIKGTPYEFEIVPYEQGQTELHTALLTNDIARVKDLLNSASQMSSRYIKQITSPETGETIEWAISTSDVIRSREMKKYINDTMRVMIQTEAQKKMCEMVGEDVVRNQPLDKWRCTNTSKK